MTRFAVLSSVLYLGAFAAVACKKDEPKPEPAASTAAPTSGPSASASAKADGKGLSAPGNDAAIVEVIKKASTCKYNEGGKYFEYSCPEYKAFTESQSKLLNDGKGDQTLVNILEDSDERIRQLAIQGLSYSRGATYGRDKALAERVIAAAENEKSTNINLESLGSVVGDIKVKQTDTWPRIKTLLEKGDEKLRVGILNNILFRNSDEKEVYDTVRQLTQDKSEAVHRRALRAFWIGGSAQQEATCRLYLENYENADEEMVAMAANDSAGYHGKCAANYDKLLALLEKRQKEGKLTSSMFGTALTYLVKKDSSKVTDAQLAKAKTIARAAAEDSKSHVFVRTSVIRGLYDADPKGTMDLLRKLEKDKDPTIARTAKELIEKKK
jgi:hypothetical protein